jgi:hypothetical protein
MSEYWIIGDDGEEYGPVSGDEIHNWINDRRVDAETRIRRGSDAPWKPAADDPEFANLVASALSAPSRKQTTSTTPRPAASGLAIASLICGILTLPTSCCCPLTGLPGIVLAVLALQKNAANPSRIGGRGMALAGLGLSLLGLALFAGFQIAGVTFDGFLEGWNNGG